MTWPEIIAAIKDVLVGLAAAITAGVAIVGITSWQRELRGKAEFRVARTLMRATYGLRDAVQDCRAPFISGAEFPSGYGQAAFPSRPSPPTRRPKPTAMCLGIDGRQYQKRCRNLTPKRWKRRPFGALRFGIRPTRCGSALRNSGPQWWHSLMTRKRAARISRRTRNLPNKRVKRCGQSQTRLTNSRNESRVRSTRLKRSYGRTCVGNSTRCVAT